MTWSLYKLVQNVGVSAPDSIIKIPDGKYAGGYGYMAYDGPRILYNGYSYPVGNVIMDRESFPLPVTDLSEAISGYDPDTHTWLISFPSDSKVYSYSIQLEAWTIKYPSVAITGFGFDDNNRCMVTDMTSLYTFTGSDLVATIDTAAITTGNELVIDRIGMRYSSIGDVTVALYTESGAALTRTFTASGDITTPKFALCDYGTRCTSFYLRVSGFTELAALYIDYHEVKAA